MKVPFLDLSERPQELVDQDLASVDRVVRSGNSILGSEVMAFEEEWSAFVEDYEVVGVASGLDALEIALRLLHLDAGSEVVVPAISAAATVFSVLRAGLTPVFADIDLSTAQLSMESVERLIGPSTKALVLVHLYGHLANPEAWKDFCLSHNLALVEDCAQAHAAKWKGRPAGVFGEVSAFSFYPTKNLGAMGDAGALVVSSTELAAEARRIRNYGQARRYEHVSFGMNSRLDEMQAAILRGRLPSLERENLRRKEIAQLYRNHIKNGDVSMLAPPIDIENHVYHLFVVRARQREVIRDALLKSGIMTDIHYPVPLHRQHIFESLSRDPEGLPAAEAFASQCLSLPCNPYLTDVQVQCVFEAINAHRAV